VQKSAESILRLTAARVDGGQIASQAPPIRVMGLSVRISTVGHLAVFRVSKIPYGPQV
jgi:hypothetical protein